MAASAAALAQSTPAFTATGTKCEDVTWSQDTLAKYPKIGHACQSVLQRDGKYFVVFSGVVRAVADGGRKLTIDFKDGERVTLNPPESMSVQIDGRATRVRDLRRGDALSFYVPQERFAAQFSEGTAVSVPIRITPSATERVALVPGAAMRAMAPTLPRTASELPALGLTGLLFAAFGATLTPCGGCAVHPRSAKLSPVPRAARPAAARTSGMPESGLIGSCAQATCATPPK